MRDQKQTSAGSLELQRCHCESTRPSQQDCLFGAGSPRAASACLLCYHMKQISLWQARAQQSTAAVKSQAPGMAPPPSPPLLLQPSQWPLSGVCHNHKISNFQNYGHWLPSSLKYHSKELQGVSTVSALWFISRNTGMHWWLCFVVISHSAFHRGGKMTACLQCFSQPPGSLMSYSSSVFLQLI